MSHTTIKFKIGEIVRPNHVGCDHLGRPLDWSVYKGAIKDIWTDGGQTVVEMIWFGEGRGVMPRTYPARDLDSTGQFWSKLTTR